MERGSSGEKPGGLADVGPALVAQIESLATDIGRVRRMVAEDSYLFERIALRVELLHAAVCPPAASLYCDLRPYGLDEDALWVAIAAVDAQKADIRKRLEGKAA